LAETLSPRTPRESPDVPRPWLTVDQSTTRAKVGPKTVYNASRRGVVDVGALIAQLGERTGRPYEVVPAGDRQVPHDEQQ
jgi:hypothetical protein